MSQTYNYLLYSFPMKREVLYTAKSRGELKKVYDNIISLSKRSPFYKLDFSKENQDYTIGIKENALELRAKLYEMQESEVTGFDDKTVKVSNEDILSAKLLSQETDNLPDTLQIKVNSLAKVQVNRGKGLLNSSFALPSGEYKFSVHVMDESYPFTYVQEQRMSNKDTMYRIADFINEFVPDINAEVETEETRDYGSLVIYSSLTGRFGDKKFSFEDVQSDGEGIVDFFGMNHIESPPSYSSFLLNGVENQTATNTFTLENTLHITLNSNSELPVDVRIVPDSYQILEAVDSIMSTYNNIIELAIGRTKVYKEHYSATKLISEMKILVNTYSEELTPCGIMLKNDGTLYLDHSLAVTAAENGGIEKLFKRENGFIAMLINKSESIAINPIDYLEKTIVFYPNGGSSSFSNPYITSMYSGMLFSSYC